MIISKYCGIKIFILFLVKVVESEFPCDWKSDSDCFLVCPYIHSSNTSEIAYNIEERWTERPQCHAAGISLGLYNIHYHWNATRTVQAHWFKAKVKVNYLEYDTSGINEMEADAFNADAFKSVTKILFTKMNLRWLRKGLFNGLESLEVLKMKDVSQIQSVYLGILDGVSKTLKEFTIESNSSYKLHHDNVDIEQSRRFDSNIPQLYHDNEKFKQITATRHSAVITTTTTTTTTATTTTTTTIDPLLKWYYNIGKNKPKRAYQSVEAPIPLEIDAFTGSEQTLNVEYVKVRYYLQTLTSQSFVALKNIKHLDLSNCGIESILQGTFDSILTTIEVLRLMNNPFKQLPAGMFELIPPGFNTFIFLGDDVDECECENLPINFIIKIDCVDRSAADKINEYCFSLLPIKASINLITTSEPTIGPTADDPTNLTTLIDATTTKPEIIAASSTIVDPTVLSILERGTINLITTIKPTIVSASPTTEKLTVSPVTVGENIEPSMLFATEPDSLHFQSSSKYIYYMIIGVALLLSLVVFIVWFSFFRQRRFTLLPQDDSI